MKQEAGNTDLQSLFLSYISSTNSGAIKYPEKRLIYQGDKIFKCDGNIGIRSAKLYHTMFRNLMKSAKELKSQEKSNLSGYIGTEIRLKSWSFQTNLIHNTLVADFDIKESA